METRTNQYPPAQMLDTLAEMNNTAARHVVGQAAMRNPRLAHLMALANELDERGFEAVLNCALFHRRFPKEA